MTSSEQDARIAQAHCLSEGEAMSDYSAASLWASSLTQADGFTRCSGCGDPVEPEDRCYADWDNIWHVNCWPSRAAKGEDVSL